MTGLRNQLLRIAKYRNIRVEESEFLSDICKKLFSPGKSVRFSYQGLDGHWRKFDGTLHGPWEPVDGQIQAVVSVKPHDAERFIEANGRINLNARLPFPYFLLPWRFVPVTCLDEFAIFNGEVE